MKLYFSKGACSLVVRLIINELGLSCEYEAVDLRTKKSSSGGDFLKVNPKGAVPTLEIKQGEVLTESAVILQYLADANQAHQLLPAVGDFKRYRVLEWLNYITTELHKGFSPLFNPNLPQEVKNTIFIPNLIAKFTFINNQLQGKQFLCGDHFTLSDAYLFVMCRWARGMKIDISQCTEVSRFYAGMLKRKAVEASLKEEMLEQLA